MSEAVDVFKVGAYGMSGTDALQKIWQILLSARDGNFPLNVSGTVTPTGQSVTPHFKALVASGSQVIPIGAKGWVVIILTGTATINGETAPAGVTVGDANTLLATVTVTCANPGTAFVAWDT